MADSSTHPAPKPAEEIPVGWFGWNATDPDPGMRDDPHPVLNRIREEHPVHRTPMGDYRILRHHDVIRVLKEIKVGVRTTDGVLPSMDESRMPQRFLLLQDPPNHTRLRRLLARAFTPPAIEAMRPHVQALVDDMLDAVADQEVIDVIQDLAQPLPSTVICQMLGVPVEDRPKFTDWAAHVTHLLVPKIISERVRERAMIAAAGLFQYMSNLIEERRAELTDDMLSVLIRAEEDGDRLSHEELITHSVGLLVAGFETTIGLIGNGVRQLLLHPDQLDKLRARPELLRSAVEECLRYDGPIGGQRRVLHEDAVIGGYLIPKNTEVMLSMSAAQRDPRVFDRPDEFDIERDNSAHLAFGGGIHFCLGAHLARMEAQIAIGTLVQRFPHMELVDDKPRWGESLFRIQASLPVRVRPR